MTVDAQLASSSVLSRLGRKSRPGRVHSSFTRTVNILCRDMTWICLHPPAVPMHPFSVRIAAEASRGSNFLSAVQDEPATVSRERIALGDRLIVSLEDAVPWECDLDPLSGGEIPAGALDAIDAILDEVLIDSIFLRAVIGNGTADAGTAGGSGWNDLAGLADSAGLNDSAGRISGADGVPPDSLAGGLQAALAARIRVAVDLMESAWRVRCVEPVLKGVKQLVGLGIGLTPSGDDFLIGFIGAAYFFAHADDFRKAVFEGMRPLVHRTNLPSFFMLKAALKGSYPGPLSDFLHAIEAGSAARVRSSAKRLTGLGATSGQDMLAGVLSWLHVSSTCGAADAAHYA
jgi:hypothetical protein